MKLMARFRISLAYLLLVAFSLIALPRVWWHDCEHQIIKNLDDNGKQAHISATQELCPICAIQIAPFITPTNWESYFEIVVFHLKPLSHYVGQEFKCSTSLRLRGPPLG